MIPTLFGIMVVNFLIVQAAPGGPVEQVIARLTGAFALAFLFENEPDFVWTVFGTFWTGNLMLVILTILLIPLLPSLEARDRWRHLLWSGAVITGLFLWRWRWGSIRQKSRRGLPDRYPNFPPTGNLPAPLR